ncbi:Eukaryotic aspartyl protease [Geosmithia morbida]|uniref:Eukaryotic aspartyl protease n=1 Tax=Geosmithia morbida TaxID=1094350 RepID=A0A9P5CXM1_9HYPO|nr:Eukaryotic aspartyl protease [Geosmithia morbida]KAF4119433.1 Eukaryotic aspartyl protease [Geosmithia morbida]
MRSGSLLTRLALCTSSVHAFYPFTPKWLKDLEEKTGLDSRDDGAVTYGIRRHGSSQPSTEPSSKVAAREAGRLAQKYRTGDGHDGSDVAKRSGNKYSVMEAEDPDTSKTAGIDQDGTDYSYFIEVRLGSEKKAMYMLIDTGAGSSWVMGTDCSSKACALHSSFGSDDSDTYKDAGQDFSVAYGTGEVKGELFTDTICVTDDICFDYRMGAANDTSDDFEHFAFDGILGLSMDSGSSDNFLDVLSDSGDIDANVFGISLHRATDGDDNDGAITFGGADRTRYKGDITYVDVDPSTTSWVIQLDDVSCDGKGSGAGGVASYIDTGTTFVFGPPDLVKAVHAVVPGAESDDGTSYTVPCDLDMPLTFIFGGTGFDVSPRDWISPKDSDGVCTSNIYGQEAVQGAWLLGDTFLKNVYAVFDADEKRIGFAARSDDAEDDDSSSSKTVTPAPATPTTGTYAPTSTADRTGSSEAETTTSSEGGGDSSPDKPASAGTSLTLGLSELALPVCLAAAAAFGLF